MKNYLLVLLAVMGLGILATPDVKEQKDSDMLAPISTMTLPELSGISEAKLDTIADIADITPQFSYQVDNVTSVANYSYNPFSYQVTVHSNDIVEHPDYSNIYKTRMLVYAHNSSNLFGNLSSLTLGSTFDITENGVTTTYTVSDIKLFEKNPENGLLQLNGSGNYMSIVTNKAFYHRIALMTCAGTSYGNGDASHRLVIFGD